MQEQVNSISLNPHPTYFGQSLDDAINNVQPERKALIENFLYEKSALMIYADDGVGKSVLTLQACMQATSEDSKVFGEFNVPEPRKVLYFQMERHPDESFERIRHLRNAVPFNKDNFALSVALQGINLQENRSQIDAMLRVAKAVEEMDFQPDIIAFDPIYTLAYEGLETASACNSITSFFRVLQITYNCTILATSHTNRGIRDKETHQRVAKDMYGNRFLSAFFTGSYHLKAKGDGVGSIWELDKNSQKNLEKHFELIYDPSNYCSMVNTNRDFSKKDRLNQYLQACKANKKEFSFSDMQENSLLSDSSLRGHLIGYLKDKLEISSKVNKNKLLYRYLG